MVKLSALIDRGRWYFPNEPSEGSQEGKPSAYQGRRRAVIQGLAEAYRLAEAPAAREQEFRKITSDPCALLRRQSPSTRTRNVG
jgi:hypothetical protein